MSTNGGKLTLRPAVLAPAFIRESFPETFVIACDANQASDYSQTCQFAAVIEGLNVEWLDERLLIRPDGRSEASTSEDQHPNCRGPG
jgi:hypothetical protein